MTGTASTPAVAAVPLAVGHRGAPFLRAARSEGFKLRTTPGPWVVLGVTAVITALVVVATFVVQTHGSGSSFVVPRSVERLRRLMGAGTGALWMSAVLGTLVVTGEYRHRVITTTLLVTPRRSQVLSAKALISVLAGVVLALATLVVVFAFGLPLLSAKGGSVSQLLDQAGAVIPGLVAAYALFALLGLGFGTLVRNQVAAIVVLLVVAFIVEPIFDGLVPAFGRWLPGSAGQAVAGGITSGSQHAELLSWWLGAIVLVAWGVVPAVVGHFSSFTKDVT